LNRLAWADAGGGPPRRYVFFVEGNSFEPITMLSTKAQALLEASANTTIAENWTKRWFFNLYSHSGAPLILENTDFESATALGPVIGQPGETSLASDAAVVLGLSSKITGGGHSTHQGALSCTLSGPGSPGGPTIDAYLAALPAVRQSTPFDAVRFGISSQLLRRLSFDVCSYAKSRPAPVILHPAAAYNTLFGSVASAAGKAAFNERQLLLDFALADVKTVLKTFPSNSHERLKLESYLTSLEQLDAQQKNLLNMEAELKQYKPEDPSTNPLYAPNQAPHYMYSAPLNGLRAQCELATAALKGDLTNVAVISCGVGTEHFDIPYATIPGTQGLARHYLHHLSGGNPGLVAAIHEITRQQVEMICKLARELAETPEPNADGSMLDHTAIVFMPENGEQHHGQAEDFPMLILGGKALGLKTGGRTLIYPRRGQDGHRQVSNVFNTLGFTAGENLTHFGNEGAKREKPGPLEAIYS